MSGNSLFMPSIFTCLNFFWGFFSIIKTFSGDYYTAAWFIILAILCDGMDGKLARWTHAETSFGFELDSLADLISSGCAPAVLVYRGALERLDFAGVLFAFLFVFSSGYRLARFNVVQAGDRSHGYSGLPVPVAGMTVAAVWITRWTDPERFSVEFWLVMLFILSVLMISKVPYDWPRLQFSGNWLRVVRSYVLLGLTALMAVFPGHTLFILFSAYILVGVARWIIMWIKGSVSISDFFLQIPRK
jgi:CDP-diacylglycerol--serine O-phosphatidyltransferase